METIRNETLDLLNRRKSLRRFADSPVSQEEKDALIQAAMRAPTAGSMMLYSILEVDDPEKKKRLVETCDHQPFIAEAPLVLMFLADYQRMFDFFLSGDAEGYIREQGRELRYPGAGDLMLACCDALIAAQNTVVAAESMGLGSCYIGDIMENYEIHRDMFGLPEYVFPITMLCYGRQSDDYKDKPAMPRFMREHICFKDNYQRLCPDDLNSLYDPYNELYKGMSFKNNAENLAQHIYARKFDSDFSREMTRSVREAMRVWMDGLETCW